MEEWKIFVDHEEGVAGCDSVEVNDLVPGEDDAVESTIQMDSKLKVCPHSLNLLSYYPSCR